MCDVCGGVSGNSGGGASGGGSCNLTLDATACNGAGNLPLKLLALMPGDFKFKSGHLRGCGNDEIHFFFKLIKVILYSSGRIIIKK